MRISDWSSDVCSSDLRKAFRHNLQLLRSAARGASQVLVGWGRLPADLLPLAREVLIDLEDEAGDVHCLGLTQAGFPIHPMARGKHRVPDDITPQRFDARSEEHTSELQSLMRISYAVFCL